MSKAKKFVWSKRNMQGMGYPDSYVLKYGGAQVAIVVEDRRTGKFYSHNGKDTPLRWNSSREGLMTLEEAKADALARVKRGLA